MDPTVFKITNLARVWGVVSIPSPVDGKSHLQSDADRQHLPGLPTRYDAYLRPSYGCLLPTRSKGGMLVSDRRISGSTGRTLKT